ncbi:MAG: hypothetical protein AABZ45_07240 [Pseudomonadota bacterium]
MTILYALLAATIGFGGGDRAVAPVGQAITAQASVAAAPVAQPCQQIAVPSRLLVVPRPSFIRAQLAARTLIGVAPQRLFAIATFGRRRE